MALERYREVLVGDFEEARLAGAMIALAEHADEELAKAEPAPSECDREAIFRGKPA